MWNVWQYIDPQASFLLLAQPPVPPTCPTYTDIKPDARHIMQLESHELTAYNMLTREYDRQLAAYEKYQKAIDKLSQGIRRSISSDNQRLIITQSLRDGILTLQRIFAPTDSSRMRQIAKRWSALCTQQPPKNNFDAWIQKWQVCYAEALDVGLDEFRNTERIAYDFLEATASISPDFYAYWLNCMHENEDYGQPLPTFSVILNRYAEHIRVSPPRHAPRIGYAVF